MNESLTVNEIVRMVGTEFTGVDDATLDCWSMLCAPMISAKKFGADYNHALALLICHRMKVAGLGKDSLGGLGDTMRLASISEGGESVSFAANSATAGSSDPDAEYRLTSYGVQFLSLRSIHCMSITMR